MPVWISIIGGAAGAALIAGIFGLITWKLNRKAVKEDNSIAQERSLLRKAISTIEDLGAELGSIKADVLALRESNRNQDEARMKDNALDARRRILRFADEVRSGSRHSLEHFNSILEDIAFYNEYCRDHVDFKNDKALLSIKIIEQVYEKCTIDNDFL